MFIWLQAIWLEGFGKFKSSHSEMPWLFFVLEPVPVNENAHLQTSTPVAVDVSATLLW